MRELCSALSSIRKRTNAVMAFQAALRGLKLDLPAMEESIPKQSQFSQEEDAMADRLMQEAMARKQAQFRGDRG